VTRAFLVSLVILIFAAPRAHAQETAPVSSEAQAARKVVLEYKGGEWFPLRLFEGADLLEPLFPQAAYSRGDWGRIIMNTTLPYATLASAFIFKSTDRSTLTEIGRWKWVGVDQKQDNYPLLFAFVGLSAASLFLPAPEDDADGYSWNLRLDRFAVFGLSVGIANLETELLKPLFHRQRPNGNGYASRPSGHATTAFAAMAFMSDILRDTFRPQEETNFGLRVFEEIACAVPYFGAAYIGLERVHGQKHYLTDVLLGAFIGAMTEHIFYSWSFTRTEQGRGWFFDTASVTYDTERHGIGIQFVKTF
jgi:membrane-associated phospholipid phosphatase